MIERNIWIIYRISVFYLFLSEAISVRMTAQSLDLHFVPDRSAQRLFDWLRRAASGTDWLLRACWYNCRLECSVMDDTCCHRVLSGVWERGEWQITHQTAQWGRSECVWVWKQERMFLPLVTMCSHVQGSQSEQQLHTGADKGLLVSYSLSSYYTETDKSIPVTAEMLCITWKVTSTKRKLHSVCFSELHDM